MDEQFEARKIAAPFDHLAWPLELQQEHPGLVEQQVLVAPCRMQWKRDNHNLPGPGCRNSNQMGGSLAAESLKDRTDYSSHLKLTGMDTGVT